jgi:hypothetical protein
MPRPIRRPIWVSVPLALITACTGGTGGGGPGDLFGAPRYGVPACDTSDGKLAGQRELHLFASAGIAVEPTTRALKRYYHRHGLGFVSGPDVQTLEMTYALDTNLEQLNQKLNQEFPGLDLNDTAALQANPELDERVNTTVARFIFRPVTDFARAHATGARGHTDVVVLPQLERPGGFKFIEGKDRHLAGLALSGTLIKFHLGQGTQEGKLLASLDLPPDFTPMMFLHDTVLTTVSTQSEVTREFVVSHEFGHASGLPHHLADSNLMSATFSARTPGCSQLSLDDVQLATMHGELGLGPAREALQVEIPVVKQRADARFPPDRLRAMLAGDREAFLAFVRPLLD